MITRRVRLKLSYELRIARLKPWLVLVSIWTLSGAKPVEATGTSTAAGTSIAVTNVAARVYAYGNLLDPPYEFSGVGSDTLFLNGYPYRPHRRRPRPRNVGQGTEVSPQPTISADDSTALAELDRKVAGLRQEMGPTHPDLGAAMADAYRQCAAVESVYSYSNTSILVKYRYLEVPAGISWEVDSEPSSPPPTPSQVHEKEMRRFRKLVDSGVLVVFGSAYRYLISPDRSAAIVSTIESAKRGVTIDMQSHPSVVRAVLEDYASQNRGR